MSLPFVDHNGVRNGYGAPNEQPVRLQLILVAMLSWAKYNVSQIHANLTDSWQWLADHDIVSLGWWDICSWLPVSRQPPHGPGQISPLPGDQTQ